MAGKFIACLSSHFMEIHWVASSVPGRMAPPGTAHLEADIHKGRPERGQLMQRPRAGDQEVQWTQLALPASVCPALKWDRTSEHSLGTLRLQ